MNEIRFEHMAKAILPNATLIGNKLYTIVADKFGRKHMYLVGMVENHYPFVVTHFDNGKANVEHWGDKCDVHKQGVYAWTCRMLVKLRHNIEYNKLFRNV